VRRRATSFATAASTLVLLVAVTACGSVADSGAGATSPRSAAGTATTCNPSPSAAPSRSRQVAGHIRVLAAASLTGAFGDLAAAFERAHPGVTVSPSFGASSGLVARIHAGAPADVLATADTATMDDAVRNGDVETPSTFTCNTMTILTAKGNPLHIEGLADLARSDVRFTLCAEPVPCGHLGREVLDRAGIDAEPVGFEANVEAVVAKVLSGEVDAGIVYVTDARAVAHDASSVPIPAATNVVTSYPIAVATDADRPRTARAFVAFVRSPAGQRILASHGFGTGTHGR
jgi:molybdate transport system substrate-binding protein